MKENPEDNLESDSSLNKGSLGQKPTDDQRFPDSQDASPQKSEANEPSYSANRPEVPRRHTISATAPAPPVAAEFEGIAANGGAVAAVVLGAWTIIGSLLTSWAAINGVMGFVLGIWGLTSKRPRLAWLGIVLCVIGTLMVMVSINEMANDYWRVEPTIDE